MRLEELIFTTPKTFDDIMKSVMEKEKINSYMAV